MKKELITIASDSELQSIIEGMNALKELHQSNLSVLEDQLNDLQKKFKVLSDLHWDKINKLLEGKGLIVRDENGELPNLYFDCEEGKIYEIDNSYIIKKQLLEFVDKIIEE